MCLIFFVYICILEIREGECAFYMCNGFVISE